MQMFPRPVALVLGHALLWAVYEDEFGSIMLDEAYVTRVKASYAQVASSTLSENVNPILKVPLVIANVEGTVVISELCD